jgi:drug/metabolite transporter (DMT)-like permease
VALWLLQRTLLFAGTSLAIGLLPRCALCLSTLALLHVLALDRIVYNNHYVLMIELCALLLAADERCLAWPLRSRRAVLPYWQLLSLQLLVLTPYFYTQIVFAMLGGWLIFDHMPDHWTLVGIGVVTLCGALGAWLTVRESRIQIMPLES